VTGRRARLRGRWGASQVYEALLTRDPAEAERVVRAHIESARVVLLDHLAGQDG
jgi:DNA-binding GntR family transcriptional regulator